MKLLNVNVFDLEQYEQIYIDALKGLKSETTVSNEALFYEIITRLIKIFVFLL